MMFQFGDDSTSYENVNSNDYSYNQVSGAMSSEDYAFAQEEEEEANQIENKNISVHALEHIKNEEKNHYQQTR